MLLRERVARSEGVADESVIERRLYRMAGRCLQTWRELC